MTSTSSSRRNFLCALSTTFIASLTQKVFLNRQEDILNGIRRPRIICFRRV